MITESSIANCHLGHENTFGIHDMRQLYATLQIIPTSETGDKVLIRSHICYWSGAKAASRAEIKASRGHTYRINKTIIVSISDYYDHRDGVFGWR